MQAQRARLHEGSTPLASGARCPAMSLLIHHGCRWRRPEHTGASGELGARARLGCHPRWWQVCQSGRMTGRDGRQACSGPGGLIASSACCTAMGSACSGRPGGAPPGRGRPVSIVIASGHGACVAAICRATAETASEMSPLLAASRRRAMSAGAAHRSATRSAWAAPATAAAAARRSGDSQVASAITDSPRASSRPARQSSSS
jgi:hypothetical protein